MAVYRVRLLPEFDAGTQGFGEDLVEPSAGFVEWRAGAEVREDDEFVLEAVGAIEEVIEVHVPELVNLFAAVFRAEKSHFGDQDFAGEDVGMSIEAVRSGVAGEAQNWGERFGGDFGALQTQVTDLVTAEPAEFGAQFFADVIDDVADGGHGVPGGEHGDTMFAGQVQSITGFDADEFAEHATAIQFLPCSEHAPGIFDDFLRKIDDGRFHLHHASSGNEDGERGKVIQVPVGDEEGAVAHEGPRAGAELEADFEFGDAPVALHGGAGIALDGEGFVFECVEGEVFGHGMAADCGPPGSGLVEECEQVSGDIGGGDGGLGPQSQVANLPLIGGEFIGAGNQAEAKATAVRVFHLSPQIACFRVDFGANPGFAKCASHLQVL